MRPPLSMMPLIPAAIAMAVGIILSAVAGPVAAGITALAVAIAMMALRRNYAAIILCAAATGVLAYGVSAPDEERLPYGEPVTLEADIMATRDGDATRRLLAQPLIYTDTAGLTHRLVNTGAIYLYLPDIEPDIEAGDRIVVHTSIDRPERRTYFPEETSEYTRMKRAGVGGKAFVLPDDVMTVSRSPAVMMRLLRVRRAITGVIYNSGMSGETKQLVNILLTGDTSDMDPELRAQFSGAGLAHVLALSGLHVGIIASLLIILLYPLRLCRRQSAAGMITILLLWAYAAVTGMSASVTRAVVMASVLLMASMLQRRHSPANALCLAGMLIMAFDPMALFTVSFQLSFAAVAGILLFARSLNPVSPRRRISHRLASMLTVTISAMLATGAVAAYYFHTFPMYFLIANVAVAPMLPLLVSGAICATILEACHCSVGWLNHTVDLLASGVTGIADLSSRLPGATVTGIYFSPWLLIGVAATVAALAYGIHRRRIAGLIASALCAAITIAAGMLSTPPDRNGIYFLPASDYTCMAVATAGDVTLISNARDRMLREISLRETPRLRDYMSRRGIASPTTANRRADLPGVIFRYPLIHIGNSYIILADDDDLRIALPEARPAYVIVCNGYRGTMADLADRYAPDTIVMSTDLNPRRATRYLRECDDMGLPAYTMRSGRLPDLNALLRPVNPESPSSSR